MSVEQNVDCCKILCINRTAPCRANIGPFHALIYCCYTIYFYFGVQVLCTVKHLSYLCYLINKIDFHPTCSESLWIEGRLRPCFIMKPKSSPYHMRRWLTLAQRAPCCSSVQCSIFIKQVWHFGASVYSDTDTY